MTEVVDAWSESCLDAGGGGEMNNNTTIPSSFSEYTESGKEGCTLADITADSLACSSSSSEYSMSNARFGFCSLCSPNYSPPPSPPPLFLTSLDADGHSPIRTSSAPPLDHHPHHQPTPTTTTTPTHPHPHLHPHHQSTTGSALLASPPSPSHAHNNSNPHKDNKDNTCYPLSSYYTSPIPTAAPSPSRRKKCHGHSRQPQSMMYTTGDSTPRCCQSEEPSCSRSCSWLATLAPSGSSSKLSFSSSHPHHRPDSPAPPPLATTTPAAGAPPPFFQPRSTAPALSHLLYSDSALPSASSSSFHFDDYHAQEYCLDCYHSPPPPHSSHSHSHSSHHHHHHPSHHHHHHHPSHHHHSHHAHHYHHSPSSSSYSSYQQNSPSFAQPPPHHPLFQTQKKKKKSGRRRFNLFRRRKRTSPELARIICVNEMNQFLLDRMAGKHQGATPLGIWDRAPPVTSSDSPVQFTNPLFGLSEVRVFGEKIEKPQPRPSSRSSSSRSSTSRSSASRPSSSSSSSSLFASPSQSSSSSLSGGSSSSPPSPSQSKHRILRQSVLCEIAHSEPNPLFHRFIPSGDSYEAVEQILPRSTKSPRPDSSPSSTSLTPRLPSTPQRSVSTPLRASSPPPPDGDLSPRQSAALTDSPSHSPSPSHSSSPSHFSSCSSSSSSPSAVSASPSTPSQSSPSGPMHSLSFTSMPSSKKKHTKTLSRTKSSSRKRSKKKLQSRNWNSDDEKTPIP